MLSGMLYCPDCGRKMYQARMRSRKPPIDYFVCSSYRKIRNGCTRHSVRNDLVEEILLDALRNVTTYARDLDCTEGANRFLAQVRKYSNIKELNAEVIREFVDRIYVHEKQVSMARNHRKSESFGTVSENSFLQRILEMQRSDVPN